MIATPKESNEGIESKIPEYDPYYIRLNRIEYEDRMGDQEEGAEDKFDDEFNIAQGDHASMFKRCHTSME
jgi:hypothetical protein